MKGDSGIRFREVFLQTGLTEFKYNLFNGLCKRSLYRIFTIDSIQNQKL